MSKDNIRVTICLTNQTLSLKLLVLFTKTNPLILTTTRSITWATSNEDTWSTCKCSKTSRIKYLYIQRHLSNKKETRELIWVRSMFRLLGCLLRGWRTSLMLVAIGRGRRIKRLDLIRFRGVNTLWAFKATKIVWCKTKKIWCTTKIVRYQNKT